MRRFVDVSRRSLFEFPPGDVQHHLFHEGKALRVEHRHRDRQQWPDFGFTVLLGGKPLKQCCRELLRQATLIGVLRLLLRFVILDILQGPEHRLWAFTIAHASRQGRIDRQAHGRTDELTSHRSGPRRVLLIAAESPVFLVYVTVCHDFPQVDRELYDIILILGSDQKITRFSPIRSNLSDRFKDLSTHSKYSSRQEKQMPRTQTADRHPIIGEGSPDAIELARSFMKYPPEKSGDLAAQLASELLIRAKDGPFYVQALAASDGDGASAGNLAQALIFEGIRTRNERFTFEGDCWHLLGALRRHTPSVHHLFGKMSDQSMGKNPAAEKAGPGSIIAADAETLEDPLAEAEPPALGRAVLSAIGDPASKDGLELTRRYRSVIGHKIPYAGALPEPGAISAAIRAEWPWAIDVARFLEGRVELMRRAHSAFVRLPPILLLGDTGSGKTTIGAALADVLDVPLTMVACGGVSDSGGLTATARGWTTSRPCAPFQAIATSHRANPLLMLDELDKGTPARSQNGSVWAGALAILEHSDRYFDPCLQANVDLSAITYIATANRLDVMPPELVDRFAVLKVPRPRPEDFDIVLRGALKAEAKSMQTDVDLLPELDRDDRAFLRDMFGKRRYSLRSFRDIVSRLLGDKARVAAPHLLH